MIRDQILIPISELQNTRPNTVLEYLRNRYNVDVYAYIGDDFGKLHMYYYSVTHKKVIDQILKNAETIEINVPCPFFTNSLYSYLVEYYDTNYPGIPYHLYVKAEPHLSPDNTTRFTFLYKDVEDIVKEKYPELRL